MVKKINILVLLLLLFVSISAVSAFEDSNNTLTTSDKMTTAVADDNIQSATDSSGNSSNDVLSAKSYTVTSSNYGNYFGRDGKVLSNVKAGDTIKLDGSFSNVNFIFDKKVTVEGTSSNLLSGCTLKLLSTASGSTVLKLNIRNSQQYAYGICLDGADNCIVKNCIISNNGQAAYPICIGNGANNNQILNNNLKAHGVTYGHGTRSTTPLVVFGSNNNYIANNIISCDDADGIYLSSYGAGPFTGGESNYNTIFNNTVKYNVLPTSWGYGIQIMGSHNVVDSNTVIGAYRGISSSTEYYGGNTFINNRVINLRGVDFKTGNPTGGDNAIVATYNSVVRNNVVENSIIMGSGSAISALDGSIVENNRIYVVNSSGKGISAFGSDVVVRNNIISTVSGAAIFQQSASTGLIVDSNKITSRGGIGILIKKVSNKERPSNITIIKNNVSTSARYIIDAYDVEKDSAWVIKDNKGGNVLTPDGSYNANRPTYDYTGKTITITPATYGEYFDDNGNIRSKTIEDLDIVNFTGTFSNKEIIINAPIKITGSNAIFINTTFKVISSGVWIENLIILNNYSNNNWGILINKVDEGAFIFNNTISVYDTKTAYAIYVVESSYVDVVNNTLFSSGDFLTYTLLSYSTSDCIFANNTITTIGTGESYGANSEYCLDGDSVCLDGGSVCLDGSCLDGSHIVQEIHRTYGILSIYSSGNEISKNIVNVSSKLNETLSHVGENASNNAIIGIDLYYNSHANIISDNIIFVRGKDNYIYGMGVLGYYTGMNAPDGQGATKNQFLNNIINVGGNYFVTGIIIGDESDYTIVENNVVNAKSNNVSYGITLEMSHKSNVKNNNVTLNSNIIYGLEVYGSKNNDITSNNFILSGDKIYGIALNSNNNAIKSNKIIVNASGNNISYKEFDSINGPISGIYLSGDSSANIIDDNNITSNADYAINADLMSKNNIISNNYLVSQLGYANGAVNSSNANSVIDNYIYLINATLASFQVRYLENGTYTLKVSDDLIDVLEGAKVDFYVDEYIGTAYVKNGKAIFTYALGEDYTPANYLIYAVISQKDYQTTRINSNMEITKGILNIDVTNISVKDGLNGRFIAKLTNAFGNPVKGLIAIFYRGTIEIGSAISDDKGIATRITVVPKTLTGEFDIKANVAESDYYLSSEGLGKLTILDIAPVNVVVDNQLSFGGVLAILTDNNGFGLNNKKVSVKIGGVSYSLKTDADGKIILPNVKAGNYDLSIAFESDSDYQAVSYNGKISVLVPISENKNSNVYYGSTVQYKVHIRGSDGNFVGAGVNVIIKVKGKSYNVKTDKNGYAIYSIKLGVGKYTVSATYNGYTVSNKITFKPTLSAKNIVKKKAKKIKFSAKLVDKNGKILKNKKITFKIKGKKYSAKTNKKGVATAVIKNLKVGKYAITSAYGGCTIKNIIKIKK